MRDVCFCCCCHCLPVLLLAGVVCTSVNLSAAAVGAAARRLCGNAQLSPACERQLQAEATADGTAAAPEWSERDMDLVASITLRQGGSLAVRLQQSKRVVLVCDGYELRYGLPLEAFVSAAVSALAEVGVDLSGAVIPVVRAMADTSRVTAAHAVSLKSAAALWVPAASSVASLLASGVPDRLIRILPEHCPYSGLSTDGDVRGCDRGGDDRGGATGTGGDGRFTFVASVVGVDGNHFSRKGLDVLLRAFSSAFDASESRVRLLLHLGSCTDAPSLSAFMRSVGLSERIGTQVIIRVRGRNAPLVAAHAALPPSRRLPPSSCATLCARCLLVPAHR
jgi:hypothetical protein